MNKMMKKILSLMAAGFLLVPATAARTEEAISAAPATVRFAQNGATALNWALFVAVDKGFFQREGIKIDSTVFSDPTLGIQGVVGGSLDVGVVAPDTMMRAAQKGGDLKILAGTVGSPPWSLIARQDIKKVADLKGKRLGSSALKGNITAVLKQILEANGLKPGDYDLIVVGGTNARYAALNAGGISGALLAQPLDLQAVEAGFPRLAFGPDIVKHYQTEVIYGGGTWAREHRDVVERLLRALIKASAWLYDPANKPEAITILAKNTKSTEDLAAQTYTLYLSSDKILPRRLEIDMEGLGSVIEAMADGGDFKGQIPKPAEFVDASFLEKAGH